MSLFEIFQPGLRHLREEQDRQNMLVSKPTHGGGAPLGIDLEGGVAKIRIKAKPVDPEPTDTAVDTAVDDTAVDGTPAEQPDAATGPGATAERD